VGKAYSNRLKKEDRPEGDFYPTPKSLIWCFSEQLKSTLDPNQIVFEPCSGTGAISDELTKLGFQVATNDLYSGGVDYLENKFEYKQIVTNPPFALWDSFISKAKQEADTVVTIGRLNYFGTKERMFSGTWDGLKSVHCFNRYVDFRTEPREDGLFHVGAMATAWFVFEKGWLSPPELHFLDVQEYAKLGNKK
jgi:hypothetical protein